VRVHVAEARDALLRSGDPRRNCAGGERRRCAQEIASFHATFALLE
jgi:hypothetical protein